MKKKTKTTEVPRFEVSSGNVFADLKHPNPEEAQTKADLILAISRIIAERRLKQVDAARILGIDQPKVSKLLRGYFGEYSVERLIRFLNRLGIDVEIKIKRVKGGGLGQVHVVA